MTSQICNMKYGEKNKYNTIILIYGARIVNKEQELMFFLGRMRGYIEQAAVQSQQYKNGNYGIFELIAEIEQYFNENLHKIFAEKSDNVITDATKPKMVLAKVEMTQWT